MEGVVQLHLFLAPQMRCAVVFRLWKMMWASHVGAAPLVHTVYLLAHFIRCALPLSLLRIVSKCLIEASVDCFAWLFVEQDAVNFERPMILKSQSLYTRTWFASWSVTFQVNDQTSFFFNIYISFQLLGIFLIYMFIAFYWVFLSTKKASMTGGMYFETPSSLFPPTPNKNVNSHLWKLLRLHGDKSERHQPINTECSFGICA